MERTYPVDSVGMPKRVQELDLQPSHLKKRPENQSLHHYHWSARRMSRLLISQTLRDLENEQVFMQNDQHNLGQTALHSIYDMPKLPTLNQMMDRLDEAKQTKEQMRVRTFGHYVLYPIGNTHWDLINKEYEREKD